MICACSGVEHPLRDRFLRRHGSTLELFAPSVHLQKEPGMHIGVSVRSKIWPPGSFNPQPPRPQAILELLDRTEQLRLYSM